MLDNQMSGVVDSWAVRWCYEQSKKNMYTIYPVHSLVENIGIDGSGTHSTIAAGKAFHRKVTGDSIPILGDLLPVPSILRAHRDYFMPALPKRALRWLGRRLNQTKRDGGKS